MFTTFYKTFIHRFWYQFFQNFCSKLLPQLLFINFVPNGFKNLVPNLCSQFLFTNFVPNGFKILVFNLCSQFLVTTNHHMFSCTVFFTTFVSSLLHFSFSQSVSQTQYVVLSVRLTGGTLGDTSYIYMYVTIFFKFTLCDVLIM